MNQLNKLSLSLLLLAGLSFGNAALAQDNAEVPQTNTTQNTTQGGGNREMVPIESAREENEGNPGNPNLESRVDARDVATVDFNDSDATGVWDMTFFAIMLIVVALLGMVLFAAGRVGRPIDAFYD